MLRIQAWEVRADLGFMETWPAYSMTTPRDINIEKWAHELKLDQARPARPTPYRYVPI